MNKITKELFFEETFNVYQNLYNRVYLRQSPLAELLVPNTNPKLKAQNLHSLLLKSINDMRPSPGAPVTSNEWRQHRLLVLRYVDGLEPQAVADQLAISRRHFYRVHKEAVEIIAEVLWESYIARGDVSVADVPKRANVQGDDHLTSLRAEVEHLTGQKSNQRCRLQDVVESVIPLVRIMAHQKGVVLDVHLESESIYFGVDAVILRQILLGIINHLVTLLEGGKILITIEPEADTYQLRIVGHGYRTQTVDLTKLTTVNELASINQIVLYLAEQTAHYAEFRLQAPTVSPRAVLVVDDNEEVAQLFKSYLNKNDYRCMIANSGEEAIQLAKTMQPYAITLDVMMPDIDGWAVLQMLHNNIETRHIPVIICTVIGAQELALALGAHALLEKPVTEQVLIATLEGHGYPAVT